MERTLIISTVEKIGEEVSLTGWVSTRRDHGKIVFIDLSDRTGTIQIVASSKVAGDNRAGDAVTVTGKIKSRPEKLYNLKLTTGKIELEASEMVIVAKSEAQPFDMGQPTLNLELPTLLDYRSLTLRHPRVKAIFQIQSTILDAFRTISKELDCVEIVVPTTAASSTEGGADTFKIDYFGHKAFLTQSPQLYKQILVPVFERVFTITKAYRAEPSVTTRHLTEIVQMDCEFCFATFDNLLDFLETVGTAIVKAVEEKHQNVLEEMGIPKIAFGKIPRLKLREAQEIIFQEFGRDCRGEKDLAPQDEIDICQWARDKHQSDFVTITHFPTKKRAFYTKPDPGNPEYSLSYDLLFRGTEMASGSQRIENFNELVTAIKDRGMNPDGFEMYLMAFRYGMPPEGGFSFGLERLTTNILQLKNIREGSLFPRDMERIDNRLSTIEAGNEKKAKISKETS